MDPALAAIIGASIGGLTALLAATLTGRRQAEIERYRWGQSRQAAVSSELRASIADVCRKIASGLHAVQWLSWPATQDTVALSASRLREQVADYNKRMNQVFPELMGSLVQVAFVSQDAYGKLRPLVLELEILDSEVARVTSSEGEHLAEIATQLSDIHSKAYGFWETLPEEVAEIVGFAVPATSRGYDPIREP